MAYLGRQPVIGNFVKLDAITAVNGQAAYTMQNGSVNFTDYSTVNQFLVSLNGTIQSPTSSFTVSGSTLTFASNLSTGDVIDFIMVFGNSLSAGTPTDATVTTAKLASDSVTYEKIGYNANPYRNIIINGDMSIAQRSTSVSGLTNGSNGYHTIDRYRFSELTSPSFVFTQSQSTTVPSGQGFATSLKMDCTTADSSLAAGDGLRIQQRLEGQNLQYLKKGTSSAESLTLSFWVRSSKTGTYICELFDNDNTRYISQSYTISSADTWEKKTLTYAGDTTGTLGNDNAESLTLNFWLASGTDYSSGTLGTSWHTTAANRAVGQVNLGDSTSNEWYVTGVQLEAGTSASDFEFLPVDVNLNRCLRYYQILDIGSNAPLYTTGDGNHNRHIRLTWGIRKRTSPTATSSASSGSLNSLNTTVDSKSFYVNVGSGGGTTGLNSNVTIDAEL